MSKPRVMLVDDSPMILFELRTILKKLDIEIVGEANDGDTALEKFKELLPDIVTLDIVMPGELSGVDLLKKILTIKPNTKVLMVTALGSDITVLECMKAGAVGFIEKPFVRETILENFRKIIG
ncbi:MAG TPA: response regulator [bacterium]|nr:response regulator [bacterium]HPP88679.1 response regulator [bacterium]